MSTPFGPRTLLIWDKKTGVMVEASGTSGAMTITAKATETNMWEARPSGFLTNSAAVYALAIVGAVVAATIVLLVIRRKRAPPEVKSSELPEEE